MTSRRQRSIPLGGRYRQISLYHHLRYADKNITTVIHLYSLNNPHHRTLDLELIESSVHPTIKTHTKQWKTSHCKRHRAPIQSRSPIPSTFVAPNQNHLQPHPSARNSPQWTSTPPTVYQAAINSLISDQLKTLQASLHSQSSKGEGNISNLPHVDQNQSESNNTAEEYR